MNHNADSGRDMRALETNIAQTRASLDRTIHEIAHRLQPAEVRAELKDALKRRLDPEPYLGWIATSMVALGGVLAVRGWRRSRYVTFPPGEYPMPT